VDDAFKLPDFGRACSLGVLVGNTRALWPRFLDALRADPRRLDEGNPLDGFVASAVLRALETVAHRSEVRFAHDPPPRRVAMQWLAHVCGLVYLSASYFNVHAVYGPWIALRAAIVIDSDGPEGGPPDTPNPCPDCKTDCMPRFRQVAGDGSAGTQGHEAISLNWRAWLAVRDACPVGRPCRYSDEQIRYHYSKDRNVLRRLVGDLEA
jgi:methylmalonic aciduria homocystinuria type C protein